MKEPERYKRVQECALGTRTRRGRKQWDAVVSDAVDSAHLPRIDGEDPLARFFAAVSERQETKPTHGGGVVR
jgi:hypothetical protein